MARNLRDWNRERPRSYQRFVRPSGGMSPFALAFGLVLAFVVICVLCLLADSIF